MPRLAFIVLSFALLSVSFGDAVFAQAPRPQQKSAQSPPSNPTALAAWCRQQIFRRYGEPVPGKPGMVQLYLDHSAQATDACVRSKGRTI